jgi:hypothetical protein
MNFHELSIPEKEMFLSNIRKELKEAVRQLKKSKEQAHNPVCYSLEKLVAKIDDSLAVIKRDESWFEPGNIIIMVSGVNDCPCSHCTSMREEGFEIRNKEQAEWLYDLQWTQDAKYLLVAKKPKQLEMNNKE